MKAAFAFERIKNARSVHNKLKQETNKSMSGLGMNLL